MPSPVPEHNQPEDKHSPLQEQLLCLRRYWYGVEPPHTLCAFRGLLGIYFLIGWLNVLPRIDLYYSSEGVPFPYLSPPEGELTSVFDLLAVLVQPPPPWLAWILYSFALLLSVLIIVGWCARTALTLYAMMCIYYWLLHMHTINTSYDRLAFVITVVLAMSKCSAVYSIDVWNRKRCGGIAEEYVPIWPARVIAMQIAFMYVGTGIYKVSSPAWDDGTILRYSLQGDWGSPLAFWILQFDINQAVFNGAALVTILIEVWAPFMLFHSRMKWVFFVLGFLFHLGIALTLNIWGFMIMPMTYILFIEPSAFKRFQDKIATVLLGIPPSLRQWSDDGELDARPRESDHVKPEHPECFSEYIG